MLNSELKVRSLIKANINLAQSNPSGSETGVSTSVYMIERGGKFFFWKLISSIWLEHVLAELLSLNSQQQENAIIYSTLGESPFPEIGLAFC